MVAARIMWIKQYQQTSYRFAPVPVVQDYIRRNIGIVDDEVLWQLSNAVEPREKKPA